MTGIYGILSAHTLNQKEILNIFSTEKNKSIDYQNITKGMVAKVSLDKFKSDKIFQKNNNIIVCTEGVILNLKLLLLKNKSENLGKLLLKLHKDNPETFPRKLLGSFQGFIYLGNEKTLILFTDQLGTRPIFYYHDPDEKTLIFGTSFANVIKMMQSLGYVPRLNIEAAYCLLTFGHMLGDLTLVEGVKRIPPGSVLTYHDGDISINQYYRLYGNPLVTDSEQECINKIANKIAKSVYMEYSKDLEGGYQHHLATLSGGIDSRTNIGFAKKLGFTNITCITFSQRNYLDEKIARKITHENGFKFIFFPLDYGDHLIKYMQDVIRITGGLVYYIGIVNLYPLLKTLPLDKFGLLHKGTLGGENFGEYIRYSPRKKYQSLRHFIYGEHSRELLSKITHLIDAELTKYDTPEIFKIYNIGVNAALTSMYLINNFIDALSPFMSPELLEYTMRIPKEYKYNKKIYTEMIRIYLPEFSKYTWESYWVPLKYPIYLTRWYGPTVSILKKAIARFSPFYHVTPFDYWYKRNIALQKEFTNIFYENLIILADNKELKDECTYLFSEGTFSEKAAVITLLKALKLFQISA